MKIMIEKAGLQTLLHSMLSCRCPVTEKTERALFHAYFGVKEQALIDFNRILAVADTNPVATPVHFLRDFCVYLQDDPTEFTITHNDVLRYFCTTYHLNRMSGLNPMTVQHPADYLVSHMLLPVVLTSEDGNLGAAYANGYHVIRFQNIFLSSEFNRPVGTLVGLHMGTVVTALTEAQALMMNSHLKLFDTFPFLAEQVTAVNFKSFENYGDYRANVVMRYQRHYGE